MPKGWLRIGIGLGLLVLIGGGWRLFEARRLRAELDRAGREMESHRFGAARKRLARLADAWPGRGEGEGEVFYRLGLCEQALGRFDAARAAWSNVSLGGPFGARAAALRADD